MSKRCRVRRYVFLFVALAIMATLSIVLTIKTATLNDELQRLTGQLRTLEHDNRDLQLEVLARQDLPDIEKKALSLGLIPNKEIRYIHVNEPAPQQH
ncbi:MAG: hypothetical protein AB7F28_06190 [Candidatus Margulisiibacteriota bacterium]